MNMSDIWDWNFYWQMFRNFTATVSPFVMIPVAILSVGLLVIMIVSIVRHARSS
ncbi:PTS ascorbate transporter subunit IIC [Paenibacillus sp. FSL K6-2859]|uniref:PTS ascorbate transporter subunit IIC n=1 Tax=Paenibacillus sp. FSL K6-2859 TaxID=2921482 RepID=UPI0030F893C8